MYRIWLIIFIILFIMRAIWIYQSGKIELIQLKNSIKHSIDKIYEHLKMSGIKENIFKRLRYFFITVTLMLFFLLALTSFIPVLFLGEPMTGLLLIIHVTVAPFFVVALMLTAIFWAHSQQFDHSDFSYLKEQLYHRENKNSSQISKNFWRKICFWLFLIISVPSILSVILSMFPYFGTDGQITMFNIHRYSVLILMVVMVIYLDVSMRSDLTELKEDQAMN